MKTAVKKAFEKALTIVIIPFMIMGIAVWGAVMFAKIGIETLIKRGKLLRSR